MGELATWDHAEACLISALDAAGLAWDTNEGDGAFYGPKVDFTLTDALGRHYQTATIQLDFQLPQRFDLAFTGANGKPASPVIIHRAILGSFERMLGILIEHTAGKWPLWLSPRQVMVCPVAERHVAYAKEVAAELRLSGAFVDVDSSGSTLQRKIRAAHLSAYNYVFVVGDSEQEQKTVNVSPRACVGGHGSTVGCPAPGSPPTPTCPLMRRCGPGTKTVRCRQGRTPWLTWPQSCETTRRIPRPHCPSGWERWPRFLLRLTLCYGACSSVRGG